MKKHIPNTLTCCNLVAGCVAVYHAFMGNPMAALVAIIVGAVFDFFDGMSARLLHVSSPIGKELDSLADDVTFGVAPAAMVFAELSVMDYPLPFDWAHALLPFVAFVMAAFSALRLAKFNLDTRQATSFIGLPTPANALFWGSLLAGHADWVESSPWMLLAVLAMVGVSSWLMVAEIPMFALKFKHWGYRGNELRYGFLALAVVLLAVFGILRGLWMVIACYVLLSIVDNLRGKRSATD